jgi:hypothetical protein
LAALSGKITITDSTSGKEHDWQHLLAKNMIGSTFWEKNMVGSTFPRKKT